MLSTPEEIFYSVIVGVALMVFLALIFVISIIRYQNKKKQHWQEKQQLQSQFKQTLLQSQVEIQEQTLQHIAHELHDNLGQVASLIKIHLNTITLSNGEKASEKIEEVKNLIRQLITDLKSLSVNLNGERIIQLGILEGLKKEIERINKLEQLKAQLNHKGDIPVLDDQTVIILYRMSQEILNNTLKHSRAKHLTISVIISKKLLTLEFKDDGSGFSVNDAMKKGGSGLINLYNRAKMIESELIIDSSSKGTTVRVDLPL